MKGPLGEWGHERGRETDRQIENRQESKRARREQKKQERGNCDTFKGCACHIDGRGEAPGYR